MTAAPNPGDLGVLSKDESLGEPFLTEVLSSLVRTNSINEPGAYEAAMAHRVSDWLEETRADVTFVESLPDRPSVAAVLAGSSDGPRLVLNGHMDTHPLDDASLWTTDPFGAEVKDGFLYGRGACDMKAGLTVQIAVARYLSQYADRLKGSLVLHFAIGEERGEPGTLSLVEAGFVGDYGIVTEPTELRVATAQRGTAWYRIRIRGRSIHASRAHLGLNPIPRLRPVLDALEGYEREVMKRPHSLLPGGSCTPSVVSAGVKETAVPDFCEITVDRRLLPGESADGELEDLRQRLDRIKDTDPEFDFEISGFRTPFEAAEISPDTDFARRVLAAAQEVTGSPADPWGTPFSSDIGTLVNHAGIETVTFGPGNVAECHCANERVALKEVRDAALATARVASDLLL